MKTYPTGFKDKTIRELNIRHETGTNIIGFQQPSGAYVVNPHPDVKIIQNSKLILIGNHDQLNALRMYLAQHQPK